MADENGVATAVAEMPEPTNQNEAATEGLAPAATTQAVDVQEDIQQDDVQQEEAPAPRASSNGSNGSSRFNAPQPELKDALRSVGEANTEHKEVPDGRAYELIYIVRANNPEASDATSNGLRALIEGADGAIDNLRASENRRLAYPIAKEIEGVYVVVNARFSTGLVPELDRFFKLEESVLRHMIVKE